ncbi:MarR family transcriptional regulator [Paenibacillus sp. SC116]|uniref:MarR family winged helix-turn-helix transcriptional regulator n=1 Tax=Paenibacillus sp. SC116 TaxID=2968986 RepID=UPI00215B18AC|nr:MarR family transcriptional regulator [Paenibacillus sp. SC116]MCR8843534.1 MarR family transcriptional regulator [Paenibacillus sp. SC116]
MTESKYENVIALRRVFATLARMDWRKKMKWTLKGSEVRLLIALKEANSKPCLEGLTVSDLSKLLQVTSPTVTQMLNSLMKDGYVNRTVHSSDRRIVEITLTDKGAQVAQDSQEMITTIFSGLIDHLGKEQSDQLIELLTQSLDYFDQLDDERQR